MGAHVVDGCGEFMPSGEDGTVGALKCAACDCHRNFHRKEVDGEPPPQQPHHNTYNNSNSHRPLLHPPSAPPPQAHHKHYSGGPMPPTMVSFGGGAAAESSSEDLNMFHESSGGGGHAVGQQPLFSGSKKRFRTKFSQDQKERMHEFALRLGWRIQKQDEQQVEQFCSEVGVKRQVFKIWMHNNKQAIKRLTDHKSN
ncbi:hypothetical protein DH2020_040728 [Rehmannia glutinosa]|uniref:ZF-HD dimerization-type domain-containing protein n=1 Tax=Rehmannia glutinosa TaxID=99300 RepID=A0ABR0US62_REHGL